MLKIRLQRTGRTNAPAFRIVVAEHTESPKTGSFVEKVGSYNPTTKQRILDTERIKYWLSVGAKASDTVHNMLVTAGVINAKKINILPAYKAPAEAAAEEAVKTEEKASEQEAKAEAKAAHNAEVRAEASSETKETPAESDAAPAVAGGAEEEKK